MQYDENAEKYGYEGEMTPLKCDELKEVMNVMQVSGERIPSGYYKKSEVDAAIAELKEFAEDACIERDDNQTAIDELQAENAELKQKLEDVQASMYCDVVDANMENRRLKCALWLARAERAIAEAEYWYGHTSGMYYIDAKDVPDEEDDPYKRVKDTTIGWYKTWMNVERKCREKAEEYK